MIAGETEDERCERIAIDLMNRTCKQPGEWCHCDGEGDGTCSGCRCVQHFEAVLKLEREEARRDERAALSSRGRAIAAVIDEARRTKASWGDSVAVSVRGLSVALEALDNLDAQGKGE